MPPIALPETPRPLVWYAACASTSPDQWSCCVKISQSRWKTWKCSLCLHLALKTNYILVIIPFFDSCQAHSWSWKVGPSCYICAVFVFCICILYLSELVYLRWPPCHNPSPPTLYLLPPSLLPPTSSHPASHTHTSSHKCSCVLYFSDDIFVLYFSDDTFVLYFSDIFVKYLSCTHFPSPPHYADLTHLYSFIQDTSNNLNFHFQLSFMYFTKTSQDSNTGIGRQDGPLQSES